MELTIQQALQQGVAAHKEGKLQDAERLYRAILNSQPKHADANHNLGVLAVSVNKVNVALPLLKTALEANPKIEQFWLSYIDALVKEQQFKYAKQVVEQAKNQGIAGNKLKTLEETLASKNKEESVDSFSPSQERLGTLLEYYQAGQLDDAEKLATSITQKYPTHPFSWKVLGAVLGQSGRNSEAINANQIAIELSPQDAEAHSNLGNTLKEVGKFEDAIASFIQAITFKPDLAEAYSNLGITLQQIGRLDEGIARFTQAIALQTDLAEAYSNLGNTLKELGRLDEAEVNLKQAIKLKPHYSEAHCNLGNTLKKLGRLDQAEVSYRQAVALKPDYGEAHNNLLTCLYLLDKKSLFFEELDYLINQDKADAVTGSLTCRSALKYGLEKPNLFCKEPLKYILHIDLRTQYDFKEIFVEKAGSILNENRVSNRKQSLLINGYQTFGNLFEIQHDFTDKMEKAIRFEIEKYLINFEDSEEGLIKKWPNEYTLYGWLISMKSGGKLKPHIHSQGWLSGSVYINVPPKSTANSGKLIVSLGEEADLNDKTNIVEEIIDVTTGSLVLFPASLTHYTIPFESEEERIVLAFDVVPKSLC